jgi:hypothetical protein
MAQYTHDSLDIHESTQCVPLTGYEPSTATALVIIISAKPGNFSIIHLEDFVAFSLVRMIPKTMKVLPRHRIDHVAPKLDANLAVLVENVFVELILVNVHEAVVKGADIREATCETKTTERVAQMGSVSHEDDITDTEAGRATLLQLVWTHAV